MPEIIAERDRKGFPMDDISYGVLIRTYGFCQLEAKLDDLVAKVGTTTNVRLLHAIASAYAACKNKGRVVQYGQLVLDNPNRLIRDVADVLSLFCRVCEAQQIDMVLSKYNPEKSPELYNMALRGFARLRLFDRMQGLLTEMQGLGVALDTATGMELSAVLMKTGKMDLARTVLATQKSNAVPRRPNPDDVI